MYMFTLGDVFSLIELERNLNKIKKEILSGKSGKCAWVRLVIDQNYQDGRMGGCLVEKHVLR